MTKEITTLRFKSDVKSQIEVLLLEVLAATSKQYPVKPHGTYLSDYEAR